MSVSNRIRIHTHTPNTPTHNIQIGTNTSTNSHTHRGTDKYTQTKSSIWRDFLMTPNDFNYVLSLLVFYSVGLGVLGSFLTNWGLSPHFIRVSYGWFTSIEKKVKGDDF